MYLLYLIYTHGLPSCITECIRVEYRISSFGIYPICEQPCSVNSNICQSNKFKGMKKSGNLSEIRQHVSLVSYLGSYRQVSVKFKDFSRTSKRLSYHFQGLKTYKK